MQIFPHLQKCNDDIQFAQGDIIRSGHFEGTSPEDAPFQVIVTADCDIANSKMGEFYTTLPIFRAEQYLDWIWAKEESLRQLKKKSEQILEIVATHASIREGRLQLPINRLIEWIAEDSGESFASSPLVSTSPKGDQLRILIRDACAYQEINNTSEGRLQKLLSVLQRNNPRFAAKKQLSTA